MVEICEEVELQPRGSGSTINDSEMSYDDLQHRVENDLIRMQKMKADREPDSEVKQEQSRRKKMARAEQSILQIMGDCPAHGFVYGIVPDKGKSVSGSSNSLRAWWKDSVKFEQAAPAAIANFFPKIMQEVAQVLDSNSFMYMLQDLQDSTLECMLSALMPHCVQPQRRFPLNDGLAPPWWPTGKELWWGDQGEVQLDGIPPYKKPRELKKAWKVSVLASIIKHMSHNLVRMRGIVNQSKSLQDKMSAKDINILAKVINEEEALVKLTERSLKLRSGENTEQGDDENFKLDGRKRKDPFEDIGNTSSYSIMEKGNEGETSSSLPEFGEYSCNDQGLPYQTEEQVIEETGGISIWDLPYHEMFE